MDAFCAFHSQFEQFLLRLRITDTHNSVSFEGREEQCQAMKRSKDIGSFFQRKTNKTSVEAEATEENVRQQEKIVTGTESASKESTGQTDSDASGPSRQQWPSFSSVLPATSSM